MTSQPFTRNRNRRSLSFKAILGTAKRYSIWQERFRKTVKRSYPTQIQGPNNLKELLKNKENTEKFRAFLIREFSEENLDFFLDCEKYKSVNEWRRNKVAHDIYNSYIAPGCMREINLDFFTKHAIIKNLNKCDKDLFDMAQRKIAYLMESDSFARYTEKKEDCVRKRRRSFRNIFKNDTRRFSV